MTPDDKVSIYFVSALMYAFDVIALWLAAHGLLLIVFEGAYGDWRSAE